MTTTANSDFPARLTAVLEDLKDVGAKDSEAMYLLGSFATDLCTETRTRDWSHLKTILNDADYRSLLRTLQEQGNQFVKQQRPKAAYAVQALAVSLVARTQPDAAAQAGNRLLDSIIDRAITAFRKAAVKPAPH